jgi:hypothetical protein
VWFNDMESVSRGKWGILILWAFVCCSLTMFLATQIPQLLYFWLCS